MNRIYQGRVTRVEVPSLGAKGQSPKDWEKLPKGEEALWRHHELFQDAVNYYILALAAMTRGLAPDQTENKAIIQWADHVRSSWVRTKRKAKSFEGPHKRLAKWLAVDPAETDPDKAFDSCAAALLKDCPCDAAARAGAVVQFLKETLEKGDLNQKCVSRLPWFCSGHGKLDATPTHLAAAQRAKMLDAIRDVHGAPPEDLPAVAEKLEPGYFVTRMPVTRMKGGEAREAAEHLFKSAVKKVPDLKDIFDDFAKTLVARGEKLVIPRLGRRPTGAYPFAIIFKLFPTAETWEAFKWATRNLSTAAARKRFAHGEVVDVIAQGRTGADLPYFDFFTNVALHREEGNDLRAVWFEFDLAAFIEAVKSPRRYLADTLTRAEAAAAIQKKIAAMERRGTDSDETAEGEDEEEEIHVGFEGDARISLLRELVADTLAFVAESESPSESRIEYTIQERTLRGFAEIAEKWRKLFEKGRDTQDNLLEVLNAEQSKHRDDFGSSTLYRALTEPKYQPIWRDPGTEKWHAREPLKAWRAYTELRADLADKERPIRFTPAQADASPRFFIFPKEGEYGTDHLPKEPALTCGIVLEQTGCWRVGKVRISYAAPRILRDGLRGGDVESLESVPWVQPMMRALGMPEPARVNFDNCRVVLQARSSDDIQLVFPVEVNASALTELVGKKSLWSKQFNLHPDVGGAFYDSSLRWPHEKQPKNPPQPWHERVDAFQVLAVDLGQRTAGAFARLGVSAKKGEGTPPSRSIGQTKEKSWKANLKRTGVFRLPGEDSVVWRKKSGLDSAHGDDSGNRFDFREELWGDRGRPARPWEADETARLMIDLEAPPEDASLSMLPTDWRVSLSFPEQNQKLLIALRRYQSRISLLHRWCWFLKGDEKKTRIAWKEIEDCEDARLVSPEQRLAASKRDPRVAVDIELQLRRRLERAPGLLESIANRTVPLRGRSWRWEAHPAGSVDRPLFHLTQAGPDRSGKDRPTWLRGQRGLAFKRIEQIEELRKRCQSLNQTMRRAVGGKPPIRRDESVPDPCPDLLEKLDHIKEQRVNQTAHMILAEALGLRLAPPPEDKKVLKSARDQHGVYEKILAPADFIVIEDLSRYRSSQGRAPRENSRLMKWCHRAIRGKLRELCEPFGLPVVETPAAYSSRFCARTGIPGFRAVEVSAGFEAEVPWRWIAEKKIEGKPTAEAERVLRSAESLREAQRCFEEAWKANHPSGKPPKRTFVLPQAGGAIFVPAVDGRGADGLPASLGQADINAAVNLGLRAVTDPRIWEIHPRLRTAREGMKKSGTGRRARGTSDQTDAPGVGGLFAREKRKFGEKGPGLNLADAPKAGADGIGRAPNFFFDRENVARWGKANIADPLTGKMVSLSSGKALWSSIKDRQWDRCDEINRRRLKEWEDVSGGSRPDSKA